MGLDRKSGRQREIDEIVRFKRAAQVGRLLLAELDAPMEPVFPENFANTPRAELRAIRDANRNHLKGEIAKFCRRNFENLDADGLARLYLPLFEHDSSLRIPLTQFIEQYGRPKPGVLRGAPLHCTIHLSPWGLQTEYPELHLVKDLAEAYNTALASHDEIRAIDRLKWSAAKTDVERTRIGTLWRRRAFSQRMTLVTCFNLVEAYVNGIASEYVQRVGVQSLSERRRETLTEHKRPINIIDKIIKIPRLAMEAEEGPLHQSREPLKTFLETVKPFRDAVVHASPFEAPEKFGGYDKLDKIYALSIDTVKLAVESTLDILGTIHRFLGADGELPDWVPARNEQGAFLDTFG